jgi:uncharacterized membrane protein
MRPSRLLAIATIGCLALWVVLAFVIAWPSGWAHVPLVAAALLAVRTIVVADAERAGDT